jgi:hypothetical protein
MMAANNIKYLGDSGHQTVLDDTRPGKLKIIKKFKPQAKKPTEPNSVNA